MFENFTLDTSRKENEPEDGELRSVPAYHGSVPGRLIRLDPDGEDLEPVSDTKGRIFVIDPKDGERTYIIWS